MPSEPSLAGTIAAPPEDLCLAFVNTRYWRGSSAPTDDLTNVDDLIGWAAAQAGVSGPSLPRDDATFQAGIALREALFSIFSSVASGTPVPSGDLALFNAALAAAEPRQRVAWQDGAFVWAAPHPDRSLPAFLSPVIWSAADLLTGRRRDRVRQCDNPRCRWVFLDDSKSGNRRWCSMASCGNRAKAHRHYLKRKGEA